MPSAPAIFYFIDQSPSPVAPDRTGLVSGWIFVRSPNRCCAVRARCESETVLAIYGVPRRDVAAAYPDEPQAGFSGFNLDAIRPAHSDLRLEWLDTSGTWHEFWRESGTRADRLTELSRRPILPAAFTPVLAAATAAILRTGSRQQAWDHLTEALEDYTCPDPPMPVNPGLAVHLDEPTGSIVVGDFLRISGWVFSRRAPVRRVFAHAEPGGAVHVVFPKPRPDVAAAFREPPAPTACGFSGMIRMPSVPACTCWFRLYAELADGSIELALSRRFFRLSPASSWWHHTQAALLLALAAGTRRYRPQSWRTWTREIARWLPPAAPTGRNPPHRKVQPTHPTPPAVVQPLAQDPLISILVPVFNPPERYLDEMIASVRAQVYPRWELCLVDDASTARHVRPLLERWAAADPRIRPTFRTANGHIARATNDALAMARGEFVALLDHDDLLPPEALLRVVETIRDRPQARFLYTDRDKIDDQGRRFDLELRGAWNPAMGLTHNYLHQLTVIRRSLMEAAGAFRPGYDGSQDLDLYLRCQELLRPTETVHVPAVCYHWRVHAGSTASRGDQKDYMFDSARRGIVDALHRRGLRAEPFLPAFAHFYGLNLHQLRWDPALLREHPVSVVLAVTSASDDWRRTVDALSRTVPTGTLQIVVAIGGDEDAATGLPDRERLEIVGAPAGTGKAALFNLGAARARHALLLLLDPNAAPMAPGWLEDLAGWMSVPGVEAAGPRIIAPDGTLHSAGWTIDTRTDLPRPLFAGEAVDDPGLQFLPQAARDSLLLDPAALLTRTAVFRALGGFDATRFAAVHYAADYCLRLHDRNHRAVFTPQATLQLAGEDGTDPLIRESEDEGFRQTHAGRVDPWVRPELFFGGAETSRSTATPWTSWMPAGTVEFAGGWFFLERPGPGEELSAGDQVLSGWCLPRPGVKIAELRLRADGQVRLLTYGHPRPDIAAAAGHAGDFLPVGFDLETHLPAGRTRLVFEALGETADWMPITWVELNIASARMPSAQHAPALQPIRELAGGVKRLIARLTGPTDQAKIWREAVRYPALPFHGFWDEPSAVVQPVYGGTAVRGWLFHETAEIRRVVASFGLTDWLHLVHGNESEAIHRTFPRSPAARMCAISGFVTIPRQVAQPLTLRIWAELADGSWHLVYVRRCQVLETEGVGAAKRGRRPTVSPVAPARPASRTGPTPAQPGLLLVTHNLNREGAPYFLMELAQFARQRTGARMTVVSTADGPLRAEFERLGMTVRLVDRGPLWRARAPREAQQAMAELTRELCAAEASLVVANTIESFWAVLAAREAGCPALFYIHEPGVFGLHYLGHLGSAVRQLAVDALTDGNTLVSFPSQATQAYYEDFMRPERSRIQPGWTDLGRVLPADRIHTRNATRHRLGLAPDEYLVITVGTLCARKGQLHFVNAIELLWRDHPQLAARCRFLLIGAHDDDYGTMLAAQVASRPHQQIQILPATPQVGDYFTAADLFVLCSFEEGFPRVLLEAMGFALPIVCTRIHALPEIVRPDEEALLVPPGDSAALAVAMHRLLADRVFAAQLGRQAEQRVLARFTAERVLPDHLRTILELAPALSANAPKTPSSDSAEPSRAAT